MAKSNFGRRVNGGKRKQTRATVPAAGAGQPESQTLQPIDANQEVNVSSKKRQQLSVRQLREKVWYTSNLLETGRKQIAVLTDANADLLERVQHLEKENSDLRVKIEKAESDKRLAEDRLADRIERFSLSRRKYTQATAATRKKKFQHRQSTTKEKTNWLLRSEKLKLN